MAGSDLPGMMLDVNHRAGEVGIGKALRDLRRDEFLFQTQLLTCPGSHSERGAKWGLRLLSPSVFFLLQVQL